MNNNENSERFLGRLEGILEGQNRVLDDLRDTMKTHTQKEEALFDKIADRLEEHDTRITMVDEKVKGIKWRLLALLGLGAGGGGAAAHKALDLLK